MSSSNVCAKANAAFWFLNNSSVAVLLLAAASPDSTCDPVMGTLLQYYWLSKSSPKTVQDIQVGNNYSNHWNIFLIENGSVLLNTKILFECEMYPLTHFRTMKFARMHSTSSKSILMPSHLKLFAA